MAETRVYWLHALTPLHVGVGSGLGFIDLPIMREKVTNWPIVPGSSVKGVLADAHKATDSGRTADPLLKAAFGFGGNEYSNSGSLVFTDARLALLPVRSYFGTFAWVCSPLLLRRLLRDLAEAGVTGLSPVSALSQDNALVPESPSSALVSGGKLYLGELDFSSKLSKDAGDWASRLAKWLFPADPAWQAEFQKRFAILPDASFDFLSETATEVAARVRLDPETKTASGGALWYEEYLPSEAVLAGLVWCDRVYSEAGGQPKPDPSALLNKFCAVGQDTHLQIGGKATIGKGRIRCLFGGNNA